MICPNCGSENAESSKFCLKCGTALSVVTPKPEESVAVEAPVNPEATPVETPLNEVSEPAENVEAPVKKSSFSALQSAKLLSAEYKLSIRFKLSSETKSNAPTASVKLLLS